MSMDLMTIAKAAAESRFFPHITSPARAFMVLLQGQEMGAGPASALRNIRYSDGNLIMQAGIVGATIKRSEKYDYVVKSHTDEECVLEFVDKKSGEVLGESKFTMEDAEKADLLVSNKGNQTLNWKRYPRNMLFARALTNGARWFCPDVFGGSVYTPDELGDPGAVFDGDDSSTDGEQEKGQGQQDDMKKLDAWAAAEAAEAAKKAEEAQSQGEGGAEEKPAGPAPKDETEPPSQGSEETDQTGAGDPPSPENRPGHLKRLDALCEKFALGDVQKKAWCKHFKVKQLDDLTAEQVGKIVATAEKKFGAAA